MQTRSGALFVLAPRVLHRSLALVGYAFLLAALLHAARRVKGAPAGMPFLGRLGWAILGECPQIDTRLTTDLAWIRGNWRLRRLPLRLLLGMAAGLPALVLFWSYSILRIRGAHGFSPALAGVAIAEAVILLLIIPAWLQRTVRMEERAGRGELRLTATTPPEVMASALQSVCQLLLLASLAMAPATILAAAVGGKDPGAVLRIHVLLAAVLNPIFAISAAVRGERTWLVGALFCAFLAARNFRAALREAASTEEPCDEEPPAPLPAETPPTAFGRLIRRRARDQAPAVGFGSRNPMWDMERLAGWRIGLGALNVAVWALAMQLLVLLGIGKHAGPRFWAGLIATHAVLLLALTGAALLASLRREQEAAVLESLVLTRLRPGEILGAKLRSALRQSGWLWALLVAGTAVCALAGGVARGGGLAALALLLALPSATASILLLMGLCWQGEALATAVFVLAAPTIVGGVVGASGAPVGVLLTVVGPPIALYLGLVGQPGAAALLWVAVGVWAALGLASWRLAVAALRCPEGLGSRGHS